MHGKEVITDFRTPSQYTGELLGVDYLYHQTVVTSDNEDLDKEIDEGFKVCENITEQNAAPTDDEPLYSVGPPTDEESEDVNSTCAQ